MEWIFCIVGITISSPPGSLCELLKSLKTGDQASVETLPILSIHCSHQPSALSVQAARPEAVVCRYPDLLARSHGQQVPPTHLICHCFDCLLLQPGKRKSYLLSVRTLQTRTACRDKLMSYTRFAYISSHHWHPKYNGIISHFSCVQLMHRTLRASPPALSMWPYTENLGWGTAVKSDGFTGRLLWPWKIPQLSAPWNILINTVNSYLLTASYLSLAR